MPIRRTPLALLALLSSAAAQTAHPPKSVPAKAAASTEALPITRVALYKNGVGFFEHTGRVAGDQSVTIDFTSAQLNDVLQSLTAIDLNGGRISGAAYNSTTPLDQQLKSLPLALSDDPSDVDFYNAIRGARVQVTAPGASISGRLLSIDLRAPAKKDGDTPATDKRFLTVVSDSGQVRTLELTQNVSVTLLDIALHTDVTRYLELLASTRNQGLRHLTLLDRGTGSRELRVSYISEVPVWKSTYRILFTDSPAKPTETATLQGWSVVDNTTGSDWLNVHLDLIAGAPQSFIQPLSTPYYTRRPEIPLPTEAQLSPQTHDSGEDTVTDAVSNNMEAKADRFSAGGLEQQMDKSQARVSVGVAGLHGMAPGVASGIAGGIAMGSGNGIGPGSGGNIGGGVRRIGAPVVNYQQAASSSIAPQTTTSAFDDFFEYSLSDPITIRKNESALVPILQTKLPVERVTLWTPQEPVALRALWITNASDLTLDRGSFSIVENGSFGGEGLLDPIHPGEKRLLSYAADQAVRVTPDHQNNTHTVTHLHIAKGVLTETSTDLSLLDYNVHNAAPDARTVIVEQPIQNGWTLDATYTNGDPAPKPAETTPTAYRFRVAVAPKSTATLHIAQRHTNYQYIQLVSQSEEQLRLLIQGTKASPAVLAALQPLFDLHNQVVALDAEIHAREADIAEIAKDQDRIRSNMSALKGSAEERSLIQRYTGELNSQEDRLASLRKELADLHARRGATDRDFQTKLEAIDLDETL